MNRKSLLFVIAFLAIIIIGLELFARYGLGLGDPPLTIGDAEIDYIFTPNQNCNRFGNRIVYNDASMRCDFNVLDNFARNHGRRVFVVGDSVVNGGVLTDHHNLATTILQEKLDSDRKNIQVCHVSAGSWGPGNYAAYFRRYRNLVGTNDVVVIEVNSHDLWEDDPMKTCGKKVGRDIALPDHKPWCALWDGFDRYFMPRMRRLVGRKSVNTKVDVPKWGVDSENALALYNLAMMKDIYSLPWAGRYMLIHRSRAESELGDETVGERKFRDFAEMNCIPYSVLILNPAEDYRDKIHLTVTGQGKMAAAIYSLISKDL